MKALIDQLPALLGVVVGVVGAMASSTLTDRLRWRRDQAVRWDQRRVDTYLSFATGLKNTLRITFQLVKPHQHDTGGVPIDSKTATNELIAAEGRTSDDWESLLLLGDADTVEAARRWRQIVQLLVRLAFDDQRDSRRWVATVKELDRARDNFHASARRGLGVHGGSVAQYDYLREIHGDVSTQPSERQLAARAASHPAAR